ncbi:peptidoglycan recognition protein-like isoform X1 [Vanessa atalanta]|uniref:peptidoglycan recognition protein-like isoform X1 n=1 Tax=Vanessa atalanta TaxID=42275 RepID=UPI001FCD2D5B|nr:peptidoglycan recognition protein-like isoform X1 [Vanessa atalanta]
MWTPNDGNNIEERGRVNNGSDLVVMDERAIAAAMPVPNVATLNVTKSSKVHIGPKFVSVTQNVQNAEMVKELPLPRYLWNVVKNSSRTERLVCAAALIVLIVCITLIVHFTVQSTKSGSGGDRPPHEWNITREMWLAQSFNSSDIHEKFEPLMLVIVQHTVSGECTKFAQCAAELRTMQGWYIALHHYDIPYNFIIGNDGRVYEGRGWNKEGAHTLGYNRCSVGIGFVGDYRGERPHHTQVTDLQLNRTRMLLEDGVRMGYLRPDFLIVGARDIQDTASPGSNLLQALYLFNNYDHKHRFRGLNCTQIQEKFGDKPLQI